MELFSNYFYAPNDWSFTYLGMWASYFNVTDIYNSDFLKWPWQKSKMRTLMIQMLIRP